MHIEAVANILLKTLNENVEIPMAFDQFFVARTIKGNSFIGATDYRKPCVSMLLKKVAHLTEYFLLFLSRDASPILKPCLKALFCSPHCVFLWPSCNL